MKYSVVIPVFNSEKIVAETVQRTVSFFSEQSLDYEIILVNDGSSDNSWQVIRECAENQPNIVAINLLKNYGQHTANLCGFREASGDYVVTMDDDLQNPPKEISKLIAMANKGHDLVIGKFETKKHSFFRRIGTKIVRRLNRKIFRAPKDLVLTNFRLVRRDVVDRVCRYRSGYPYVPGLVLMFSSSRANVLVEHHERKVGKSNYTIFRIVKLVSIILFNYSSFPLRLVAGAGLVIAIASFLLSAYYLVNALLGGTQVAGWATLVVLLSFFNGVTLLILGMLGEYVIRVVNQLSHEEIYHVSEIVKND